MSVTERIVRGFKARLGARVVDAVVNGVLTLLLARVLLTPDEYGLLFLVIAIIGVVNLPADLGLSRSAARYISERQASDPGAVPFILRTSFRYKLLLVVIAASGLIVGSGPLGRLFDTPELTIPLVVGACYLAVRSFAGYSETLFQGFNRVTLSAVVRVIHNISRLIAVVSLTALGFGVVGALVGYAAGAFVAAVVGLTILYREFYVAFDDEGADKSLRNRILKYSVPLTASQSANILDKRIDTVLIGFFLNPLAVSYYVLGKQITEFVLVPAGSLGFSVSPTYGEQKANDALNHAARIYESTIEFVLLLYLPAAIGILLLAEPTVTLIFGANYADAAPVLQILGVYVVFQAITNVTTNGLDYLGRAKDRAIAKGVTSAANVILNVALIPIYGPEGAAMATVVTFGIYTLVNVYVMYLELPLEPARIARHFVLTGAVSVTMGVVVLLLVPYTSTIPALAGVISLGVLVWAVLGVASGLLDVYEVIGLLT